MCRATSGRGLSFISYQLRRMIDSGKDANVARINKYIRWPYPVAYLLGIGGVTYLFA